MIDFGYTKERMCLEKGGDGPILSSNVDPAPQFWGYTVRGILSRGDTQEDEKQKPSVGEEPPSLREGELVRWEVT